MPEASLLVMYYSMYYHAYHCITMPCCATFKVRNYLKSE